MRNKRILWNMLTMKEITNQRSSQAIITIPIELYPHLTNYQNSYKE
jgi:hypothetical protein